MFITSLIIVMIIWILTIWWKNRHKRKLYAETKSNLKCWPIVGHGLYFVGTDKDRMRAIQEMGDEALKQGGMTSIWLAHKLFVMLADPIDSEYVLKNCLEKDDLVRVTRNLVGSGSLFAPVSIWRPRRKVLSSKFSLKRLNQFMDVHFRMSSTLVERLKSVAGAGSFSLWGYVTAFTMDTIGETALGTKLHAQDSNDHPFPKVFTIHCEMQAARLLQPWLQNDFLYQLLPCYSTYIKDINYLKDFVNQLIAKKREAMNQQKNTNDAIKDGDGSIKSFLECFLEPTEGLRGFTDEETHEETLVLAVAGTDTTAVGLSFTALLLAQYQDVQEKIYQEICQTPQQFIVKQLPSLYLKFYMKAILLYTKIIILHNSKSLESEPVLQDIEQRVKEYFGDSNRPIVAEDLPQLKYLDAVIKEVLRFYPPVPMIVRKVEENITLPSGKTLIPDIGVFINIWALHRNKEYWGDDVECFRPERFLGEDLKHPAYMPFSRGPRNCIGFHYALMSMKTCLINLLKRYRFLPSDPNKIVHNQKEKHRTLDLKYDIMLKHVDNFTLKIKLRE